MNVFDSAIPDLYDIPSRAPGPTGSLPFTPELLREWPSGHLFGWTQNAGMGWKAEGMGAKEYLVLSTHGGVRAPDGTPVALGYHCLLYTSDAADERSSVDLGGRRIIKK